MIRNAGVVGGTETWMAATESQQEYRRNQGKEGGDAGRTAYSLMSETEQADIVAAGRLGIICPMKVLIEY